MKQETEDVVFLGTVKFLQLPLPASSTLQNDVQPDVTNLTSIIGSGIVVTITDFLGGVDSHQLSILGDGTTTISHNARIATNTGANKLLATNKVYRFTYFESIMKWIEDA